MFSELFYSLYLALTVLVFAVVPARFRTVVLGTSGTVFYAYYGGYFVFLLLFLTVLSWVFLFGFHSRSEPVRQSRFTPAQIAALCSIPVFVLVLAYFKYGGFISQIFTGSDAHKVIAPLAISFFTFEFIHIAFERYRGNIDRISFLEYFSFIFFFPTMIAGPIKRYGQFSEKLQTAEVNSSNLLEGLFRIVLGLFKKLVLADNLNTLINEVGTPEKTHNVVLLTGGIILYGFRIFLDFSGYSDIAIGSARLFGIRVPENFLYPYRQTNISNFWRNWHISLYTWLIDYVFIPLGGSRVPFPRLLGNLMIVMLVSGLWHGAAWNFLLWGAWHGTLLVTHRVYSDKIKPSLPLSFVNGLAAKGLSYAITMTAVWFGWMLFMWPVRDVSLYLALVLRRPA